MVDRKSQTTAAQALGSRLIRHAQKILGESVEKEPPSREGYTNVDQASSSKAASSYAPNRSRGTSVNVQYASSAKQSQQGTSNSPRTYMNNFQSKIPSINRPKHMKTKSMTRRPSTSSKNTAAHQEAANIAAPEQSGSGLA